MSISAIGSTATASPTNQLTLGDLMNVLLTQLTYQDPLKPMDNEQFMAQVAQFTTLEQTQSLNTSIQALLNNQSSLQSVGLIGRTVDIQSGSGPLTGTVTGVSLAGSSPTLTLSVGGATLNGVGLDLITAVR
jgi:flagellar basal-body rod modification protein FlgD